MPVPIRGLLPAALTLVLLLGAGACGADDKHAAAKPSSPSASQSSTQPDPVDPLSPATDPAQQPSALPSDFPRDEVPLVAGEVTTRFSSDGSTGRKGWVLDVNVPRSTKDCYRVAGARLVGEGFTKTNERTYARTREALYDNGKYAVIITALTGTDGSCTVSYEVGEVGK